MFFRSSCATPSLTRNDLVDHLERHGIETRYLLPLINQPVYRDASSATSTASTRWRPASTRTRFYIGCQPEMTDDDVDYVIACFESYLRA